MTSQATSRPGLTPRVKADLLLLLVAVVWGSAFVAQRVAAQAVGVFLFNGLRFLVGALVLLPFLLRSPQPVERPRRAAGWVILAGGVLFGAAALQQLGLRYTTAGNAGFITGLYVVLVPLLLALAWRQVPGRAAWAASLLAAAGLFLLSTGGSVTSINRGDLLELAGAFLWALHVILIGRLVQHMPVAWLATGQYLVCGLASLAAGLALERATLPALPGAAWAILYTGLFSIGLGYTLQAVGQRVAPPSDAAVILSGEAVFAALFGWLLLEEILGPAQLAGCGLILLAILLAQWKREPGSGE